MAEDGPLRRQELALVDSALARLEEPLVPFLRDALGVETRIDLVARCPLGGAVVVLLASPGSELEGLGDALAQAAWLGPRIADWARLAPELRLAPERGVRALLIGREIDERTRLAAGAVGPERVQLARLEGDREPALLRVLGTPSRRPTARPVERPALRSVFRTGLREEDLALPAD